jgi:hypothetical protein
LMRSVDEKERRSRDESQHHDTHHFFLRDHRLWARRSFPTHEKVLRS